MKAMIADPSAKTPYEELTDQQYGPEVALLLEELDEREREILRYRYGLGDVEVETLEKVGKRYDITRERVRQIQKAALEKLRERFGNDDGQQMLPRNNRKERTVV